MRSEALTGVALCGQKKTRCSRHAKSTTQRYHLNVRSSSTRNATDRLSLHSSTRHVRAA
ncbi:hypothetical protein BDR03DRAFT_950396 [Suillus americanus]|nr:hypothetical protein BDR03DRAFT_950396 [Suillus americanus]